MKKIKKQNLKIAGSKPCKIKWDRSEDRVETLLNAMAETDEANALGIYYES
jgi:hypothetical protein